MDYLKLLPAYIRAHITYLVMAALFAAVFAVMTLLYHAPADGVIYALILCGFAGIIAFIFSYRQFVNLHRRLKHRCCRKQKSFLRLIMTLSAAH